MSNNKKNRKQSSVIAGVPIAYIAIFTALYVIAAFIPVVALMGSGASIGAAAILTSLNGILLGPIAGGVVSLIGGLIAAVVAPHTAPFGPVSAIFVCINSIVAGFVIEKKWLISSIVLLIGIVLTYTVGVGKEVWYYGWGYILFFILLISPLRKWAESGWEERHKTRMAIIAFIAAGSGVMADHCLGSIGWYYIFSIPKEVWSVIGTLYLIERIPLILAGVLLSMVIIRALDRLRMPLRMDKMEKDKDEKEDALTY